jgi:hypothetical protein
MKSFLKKNILFSIPLILYFLSVIYVDPYNIIREEHNSKLIELKSKISYKLNYTLYKLPLYKRKPTDIVILGDSRANQLKPSTFERLLNINTTNLAYGAGTLSEVIQTFNYIKDIHSLKQVYIGINFNMYNNFPKRNRVIGALKKMESNQSYLVSKVCLKSTFLMFTSFITNKEIKLGMPLETKSEFWEWQLKTNLPNFYSNYEYPSIYYEGLKEISNYCKENNIKLIFFIPPTHVEQQQSVINFDLAEEEVRFRDDIKKLGTLYDFDYPNEITKNKTNFSDPLHPNDSIVEIVTQEIVTGNLKYARTNTIVNLH